MRESFIELYSDMLKMATSWLKQAREDAYSRTCVEKAGGEYLGNEDGLVWFNDPRSHSTFVVKESGCSVEAVKARLEEARKTYSK